jgi:uncharacterized repeat protein (TIGR03837 family)
MQWDIFCRVIDNFGDIGVCWRLAADLGARGERVRLWVDDASALRWMAPRGSKGVEVRAWPDGDAGLAPGEVVLEAFGCELPGPFVGRMAAAARPPLWINLEYLSAEDFVERSHRLGSPQTTGPGAGLRKWFFFPGFTHRTGGLIREPALARRQARFDATAWLASKHLRAGPQEQIVSLFCYEAPALPALIDRLSRQPSLLLATSGHAARQVGAQLGPGLRRGALRAALLPPLTQRDYDHLLWASDINFVRGEDSLVRAHWAGRPFVWQAYPQRDGIHRVKLDALLARLLDPAPVPLGAAVRDLWHSWNAGTAALPPFPDLAAWRGLSAQWRGALLAQTDLCAQLLGFAAETR